MSASVMRQQQGTGFIAVLGCGSPIRALLIILYYLAVALSPDSRG